MRLTTTLARWQGKIPLHHGGKGCYTQNRLIKCCEREVVNAIGLQILNIKSVFVQIHDVLEIWSGFILQHRSLYFGKSEGKIGWDSH